MNEYQQKRNEAALLVEPFIVDVVVPHTYKAIPITDVEKILGKELAAQLLAEPIRGAGPPGHVYYWNVIDYIVEFGTLKQS